MTMSDRSQVQAKYAELKAEVLQRFAGCDYTPDGPVVWAWHVHHNVLAEVLEAPISQRVDCILNTKDEHEIPTRLQWLWPVKSQLPECLVEVGAAYKKVAVARDKAAAWYNKAWAAYDEPGAASAAEARAAYCKARAAYDKARVAYDKAWVARHDAWNACRETMEAIHKEELPGCPWDGTQLVFDAAEAPEGNP